MTAILMRARAELRSGVRSTLALVLILGIAGGVVLFSATAARRTDSAYSRLIGWSRQPDALVSAGGFGYGKVDLAKAASLPEVASSATVHQVTFYPATTSGRLLPVGGGGGLTTATARDQNLLGRVKLLAGRRPDPHRAGEIEVGYASEDFTHVRVGTHLLLHFWKPNVNALQYYRGELPLPLSQVPPSAFAFNLPVKVVGIAVSPGDFPQIGPYGDVTLTPAFYRTYGHRIRTQSSLAVSLRRG